MLQRVVILGLVALAAMTLGVRFGNTPARADDCVKSASCGDASNTCHNEGGGTFSHCKPDGEGTQAYCPPGAKGKESSLVNCGNRWTGPAANNCQTTQAKDSHGDPVLCGGPSYLTLSCP